MSDQRVQRRLAAIAIGDVVGYSRMMGQDELGTLKAVSECRRAIIEPVVAKHRGRIVKLMGDGFFLEFASAVDAVEAAIDLQARTAEANASLPESRRIVIRIGINLGEVIVEGEDLFGDGVNVAARLESIAAPGGITISGSAYDQVRSRISATMEDLGALTLKNIAQTVRAYRVVTPTATAAALTIAPTSSSKLTPTAAATPATTAESRTPDAPTAGAVTAAPEIPKPRGASERPSIAILPFANLGDDPAQGFFSDGVTEDIITELSRWRLLAVRSRSASFRFRGVAQDLKQVARELDARYLVEGSVRRMGERIRIVVQLIDSETGGHVWAEKFDRAASEIFAVQDQVVQTIVSTLVGRVQASDVERARRKPPSSLAAYEYLLQGNALAWDSAEGAVEARRLFERAIELDPDYGFAHALLAAMRYNQWIDDYSGSDVLLDEAYNLARRAVALDDKDSACFAILSWVYLKRRSFDQASQCSQRSVELNPSNQWSVADRGGLLTYLGQAEEAMVWLRRAREIDPFFDPAWYWRCLGQAQMLLTNYDEALGWLEHARGPAYRISALMAGCHARLGRTAAAQACAQDCLRMKPDFTIARYMAKEPFKRANDSEQQAQSLRLAGLPE